MKYEFHVGDYVEMVGGFVGWVSHVDNGYITIADNGAMSGPWLLPEEQHRFVRIGQYDFTKTDDGKIEPLCKEYTKSFPFYKTTTTGNESEWCSIDFGVVGKKINELVEAVNRLEDKANEVVY